ncbi:ArnT family glycosyltransferase [Bacteroidota bacterium]
MDNKIIYRLLVILIVISTIIRLFLAGFIEFGNDEVYYWTYALYPDLSHFDHPPMVGWLIQLFSLNLFFQDEVFIRLGAVVFSSINIYLIFLIGKWVKNIRTGFFAALLYTASIYGFIISGTFMLPDAPQMIFWFLALYFLIRWVKSDANAKWILLFGIVSGLAIISKHTSVFLWVGVGLYILFYQRKYLLKPSVYISFVISVSFLLPVLIWNINNDWISFTYQGERVNFFGSGFKLNYLLTELGGQIAYNNPVNFVIIIISLIALIKKKQFIEQDSKRILLLSALPIILVFLLFSMFRQTLPHWSAPGFSGLIIVAAAYLDYAVDAKSLIPGSIKGALALLIVVLILGIAQINYGLLFFDDNPNPEKLGKNDFTLDMYGWKQLREKFQNEVMEKEEFSSMKSDPIISYRWFPAANIDYYVAYPLGMQVKAIADLERIHKYAWINAERGDFKLGSDAWFITFSTNFYNPYELYQKYYNSIYPVDTLDISRGNKVVKKAFVFRMEDMKLIPDSQVK